MAYENHRSSSNSTFLKFLKNIFATFWEASLETLGGATRKELRLLSFKKHFDDFPNLPGITPLA